jgi:hypothetical protein
MPKISDYVKRSFHSNLNVVTPYFILIKAHMAVVDVGLIPDHTSARIRSSGPPRTSEERRDLRTNHQRITICTCVTKNGRFLSKIAKVPLKLSSRRDLAGTRTSPDCTRRDLAGTRTSLDCTRSAGKPRVPSLVIG